MTFEISDDAASARFIMPHNSLEASRDFWRLILDDGLRTEIPVVSHSQHGTVEERDNGLMVRYDRLVSEYGDAYDVALTVEIEKRGELLQFSATLFNGSEIRVNECFCPVCAFDGIAGNKADDMLFMPYGTGSRSRNPYAKLEAQTIDYYAHDRYETFWHLHYPQASMCWMGVQSGDKFLYMSRYDEKIRCCFLSVRHTIHTDDLMLAIDHFPMARSGETVKLPPVVVGLLDGDWTAGADCYRAWAENSFYRVPQKAEWVQNMTGWQRIIMRSQYGEDYYTAEDLPRLYEIGAKYGIKTLFLFAWWKEGMDKGYPHYNQAYEGAYDLLKENIRKVQKLGGRVILECNCHFIDPQFDFYNEHGDEVKIIDINGNEVRKAFVYPGSGEFRAMYGAKQFPVCCSGAKLWRDQVLSQLKKMNQMEPDCLFADCYGAAPTQPCFNDKHEHGNRVDEEWVFRRKFYDEAVTYARNNEKVLAAEIVTDIAASYSQFLHGLFNVNLEPTSDQFPPMFRYTFPDVITTNRGVRCSEGNFEKQLKSVLVYGMRFDCELFTCRADLDCDKKYADVIAACTRLQEKYSEFLLQGKFTVSDRTFLPDFIKRGEFVSKDGSKMLTVIYNTSDAAFKSGNIDIAAGEILFGIKEI